MVPFHIYIPTVETAFFFIYPWNELNEMKSPFKCLNDSFSYSFLYFNSWNHYPFISFQLEQPHTGPHRIVHYGECSLSLAAILNDSSRSGKLRSTKTTWGDGGRAGEIEEQSSDVQRNVLDKHTGTRTLNGLLRISVNLLAFYHEYVLLLATLLTVYPDVESD